MVAQGGGCGGDPHYNESKKDSHTVCPFFLFFFGVQADSVFFPRVGRGGGWGVVGGRGVGEGGGAKERHRKRSRPCEASSQASPRLCVLSLASVSLQKLAGLPLSVCFVVFVLLTPGVVVYLL